MKAKKTLSVTLAAAMAAGLLAGCGNSAASGSCCAQRSGAQEVAARDLFAHSVFLLLFLFLLDRVLCRSSKAKRQTLLLDKQSLHVRAARRSRVILTKISRVFVRGDKTLSVIAVNSLKNRACPLGRASSIRERIY